MLATKIKVDTHYTRSINLERDRDNQFVLNTYLPTTRAVQTLERIAATFGQTEAPRAWALIGPYGSGKSAFGIFCTHLLSAPNKGPHNAALKILRRVKPSVASKYKKQLKDSGNICQILITGGPEPFGEAVVRNALIAAERFWHGKRGKRPAIIGRLRTAQKKGINGPSDILKLISDLQDAVSRSGGNGIVIAVDELGKFLEYEARHYGRNDIFLLQMLAEQAQTASSVPMYVLVLLHQTFEQYARGLGEALRTEWAKIQGRFETIPFLESTEQTLRVVARTFQDNLNKKEKKAVLKLTTTELDVLQDQDVLPPGLLPPNVSSAECRDLFSRCYPLHPLTALLLPPLCQKVAQNERTLFSYLGSAEPSGFQDSLSTLASIGDWILPHELYNYFVQNQPMTAADPLTIKRWAEIDAAIDRLGDAPEHEIQVVKTIGLLNLIGTQGKLRASREVLNSCFTDKKALPKILKTLESKSIIQYRRYSNEYRVWQGSDFDIDHALQEANNEIGRFDLAEILTQRQSLEPLVARRHSYETGHLRFMPAEFRDRAHLDFKKYELNVLPFGNKTEKYSNQPPTLMCYLAEGEEDVQAIVQYATQQLESHHIIGICPLGPQLRTAMSDVLALEHIQQRHSELNSDPVALREVRERLAAAHLMEDELVSSIFERPDQSFWYWRGQLLTVNDQSIDNKRLLQESLSAVMSSVYSRTPIIRNELLNRDKPSPQANAARNKLLQALLKHRGEQDLDLQGNSAEKSIYASIIKTPGLHRSIKNHWDISDPPQKDPSNFLPFWTEIDHFFESSITEARPLTDLSDILVAPPYGLKRGILSLFFVIALLRHEDDTALYENRVYSPYFTQEVFERLIKRPQDFTIQRFKIEGMRRSLFNAYSQALFEGSPQFTSIISIAKPLARFIADLPEYTQQTKRLSSPARGIRDAFKLAKSPQVLLFELIPSACGVTSKLTKDGANDFSEQIVVYLRELKNALPDLTTEIHGLITSAFRLHKDDSLEQVRATLAGRLKGLEDYTIDAEGLRAFINRCLRTTGTDEEWFGNLLLFLGRKPIDKWSDMIRDTVELRLAEYSRRINDLEKLRVHYDGLDATTGDLEVLLLKTSSRSSGEKDEIVLISNEMKAALDTAIGQLNETLEKIPDSNLRLAAIASIADEFLVRYREREDTLAPPLSLESTNE